jgi:hypothetical protein
MTQPSPIEVRVHGELGEVSTIVELDEQQYRLMEFVHISISKDGRAGLPYGRPDVRSAMWCFGPLPRSAILL